MNVPHWLAALALGSVPCAGMAAQTAPSREPLQIDKPMEFVRYLFCDVDGDGRTDLTAVCAGQNRRELRTFLRRATEPQFGGAPSIMILDKDVVAFAFVQSAALAPRTLVLFTPERAIAVQATSDGAPSYAALFAHQLVWPAADPTDCVPLQSWVTDLDGDGREDVVVPEPDGARVVLQQASTGGCAFAVAAQWQLPPRIDRLAGRSGGSGRSSGTINLRLRSDDQVGEEDSRDRGPLVEVRARTPTIQFLDLDGDRRLDGWCVRNEAIWWWPQTSPGHFAATAVRWPLPLPEDRLPVFDPAFDVQLHDTDRDGRADLVLTTSSQRDGEIEVRIDLYRQQAEGNPWRAGADSRLRLQTLAAPPQLADVDGDGVLDLVAITLRTDLLGALQGGAAEFDVQSNVFRGDSGRFVVPALLTQKLSMQPRERRRGGGTFVRALAGGSGKPGSLLVHDGASLQLRPLVRDGKRLELGDPEWRVPVGDEESPVMPTGQAPELVVSGGHDATVVRWR